VDYSSDLDRVLRMARKQGDPAVPVTVADMHPSLRFTRLGAHLRAAANSGWSDDISSLARAALLSDHDQPLDLMPLHLLRDATAENSEHPLSSAFNWHSLPEKVELDEKLRELVNHNNTVTHTQTGRTPRVGFQDFRHRQNSRSNRSLRAGQLLSSLMISRPDITLNDVDQSAYRLGSAEHREYVHYPIDHEQLHDDLANDKNLEHSALYPIHPERY
jgi:hypothetical protein